MINFHSLQKLTQLLVCPHVNVLESEPENEQCLQSVARMSDAGSQRRNHSLRWSKFLCSILIFYWNIFLINWVLSVFCEIFKKRAQIWWANALQNNSNEIFCITIYWWNKFIAKFSKTVLGNCVLFNELRHFGQANNFSCTARLCRLLLVATINIQNVDSLSACWHSSLQVGAWQCHQNVHSQGTPSPNSSLHPIAFVSLQPLCTQYLNEEHRPNQPWLLMSNWAAFQRFSLRRS